MRKIIILMIIFLAGCNQPTPLLSMEGHIYCVPKGAQIQTTNHGLITTKYEGIWVSEEFMIEIWEVDLPE